MPSILAYYPDYINKAILSQVTTLKRKSFVLALYRVIKASHKLNLGNILGNHLAYLGHTEFLMKYAMYGSIDRPVAFCNTC